ncbi:unnamed protein product [Rotaria magnacalcarata]|uniref:non-specific protein-tyrosine kinase n=2 Tax=Rotaria magnacalcarata TaxID=392030 RepID=A0A815FKY9_9BILA|nr:unnamed protein product [Rotaria magnacalcarata]
MLMTGPIDTTVKHDHLPQLRQFLEQIELEEYYTLIVEKLKVYSIGDLRYANESDLLSLGMSKPQFRKVKRHMPSSYNTALNNNTMLTSTTLGKLLVRKLTLRSTSNLTRSTFELNSDYEQQGSSITSLNQQTNMGKHQQQKNIISQQNIQLIEKIGEGEFGTVYKAFWKAKQTELLTVAVKRLNKLDQDFGLDDILKEVCVLQDIEHTHIVQFFGIVIQTDGSFMLVTEYAHSRSLYECLLSNNAKCEYTIEILIEFLRQITTAMSYLEKKFLIHRDLACRNILVFNKSLVKLSDFGLSRICCSETNYYKTSWKDTLRLPIAWMSPEAINFLRFTSASDIFSFGVCMWECFTYGQMPWQGMSSAEIVNAIDAPNHQRLPRPPYATTELYQIMLQCWKHEPTERPTFSQLEKTLREIELKQVRWKDKNSTSTNSPDGFLSIESCALGPLTILDRCLNVPISSSSVNNFLQCVSVDGQIGFVYNTDVEPLHVISISKPIITTLTKTHSNSHLSSLKMSNFFHRKTDGKKNCAKAKSKQLSKDMIGLPQPDFIHAFHIGVSGETFGDVACLAGVEKTDLIKIPIEQSPSNNEFESNYKQPTVAVVVESKQELDSVEQQTNNEPTSSLLDEVLQAFTEIYCEPETTPCVIEEDISPKPPPKPERSEPTSPKSPTANLQLSSIPSRPIGLNQSPSDNMTDSNSRSSPIHSRLLKKSPLKRSNEETCRFSRELEQRLQNGDISEEAKHAYNLLVNGCTNSSSLSHEENLHSTSNDDLSSNNNNNNVVENNTKQSPSHPVAILFGSSSSSSSTSISIGSSSNNTQSNTSSSSSSDQQKTDRHSHYSSTSTDNDISIDLKPQTDLSPLKLLRNGINPSSITSKHMRQQLSAHDTSSSNHSPISSTSNTLSNLSITSPLYEHHLLLLPPPSQSSSSSNNDDNRSLSSLNSRSLSINKSEQNSITGQPLPPPPDLSSLGSKLTTATMTHTLKLPAPLTSSTSNPYRSKKRFNLFTS